MMHKMDIILIVLGSIFIGSQLGLCVGIGTACVAVGIVIGGFD